MVLPPPAAGAVAAQADEAWLRRLIGLLELAPRSVMVLVEAPDHASIATFIRAVDDRHGFVHVLTDMHELLQLPEGALVVLCPRPDDAEWLNIKRPWIVERSLRVLIWADHALAGTLHERAPDFFDWISHHQPCPPTPVWFAQAGLRAAMNEPGVCWPDTPEAFESLLLSVVRDAKTVHISAALPYQNMVAGVSAAGDAWIVWSDVDGPARARRARWSLAEVGRLGRSALCGLHPHTAGWTPLHANRGTLHELAARLATVDAPHPARLAVLCDQEPEAVDLLIEALRNLGPVEPLATLMCEDPGASLAPLVFIHTPKEARDRPPLTRAPRWRLDWQQHLRAEESDLNQRLRASEPGDAALMEMVAATEAWREPMPSAQASPRLRGWQVEALLRGGQTRSSDWLAYATVAGLLANHDVQLLWANHGLAAVARHEEDLSAALADQMFSALDHLDNREVTDRILTAALKATDKDATSGALLALRFAHILTERGKLRRAETLLRDTLHGLERALTPEHPELRHMLLEALVDILDELGSPDAPEYHRRLDAFGDLDTPGLFGIEADEASTTTPTLVELTRDLGADHPRTVRMQLELAEELAAAGRHEESRTRIDAACRAYESSVSQDPPLVAELAAARISAHFQGREFVDAERVFREVSAFFAEAVGLEHPAWCALAEVYAELLAASGRTAEAEAILRELLRVVHDAHGPTSELHRETVVDLAELLCDAGRWNEADACLEPLIPALTAAHVDDPDLCAEIDLLRARVREGQSLFPEAEALLRGVLARHAAGPQEDRRHFVTAVTALGKLLMGQARYVEAADVYADSIARSPDAASAWADGLARAKRAQTRSSRAPRGR